MASRCSTELVEPPVAATLAIAFSNALRVRISLGRVPRRNWSMASRPVSYAASSFFASIAGMLLNPMGERPINSITVDIVLAVNWPPQAPAAGQALSSSFFKSASDIRPAACAPMAS